VFCFSWPSRVLGCLVTTWSPFTLLSMQALKVQLHSHILHMSLSKYGQL
jgi:hypothetical protein